MADDASTDLEQQAKDAILKSIIDRASGASSEGTKHLAEAWSLVTGEVVADFGVDDE